MRLMTRDDWRANGYAVPSTVKAMYKAECPTDENVYFVLYTEDQVVELGDFRNWPIKEHLTQAQQRKLDQEAMLAKIDADIAANPNRQPTI